MKTIKFTNGLISQASETDLITIRFFDSKGIEHHVNIEIRDLTSEDVGVKNLVYDFKGYKNLTIESI